MITEMNSFDYESLDIIELARIQKAGRAVLMIDL